MHAVARCAACAARRLRASWATRGRRARDAARRWRGALRAGGEARGRRARRDGWGGGDGGDRGPARSPFSPPWRRKGVATPKKKEKQETAQAGKVIKSNTTAAVQPTGGRAAGAVPTGAAQADTRARGR